MKILVHVGLLSPSPFPPHGRISSYVCSGLILLFIYAECLTDVCLRISKSLRTSHTLLLLHSPRRIWGAMPPAHSCLLPIKHVQQPEIQCWEKKQISYLVPLCSWFPATQHNEGANARGAKGGKFLHGADIWELGQRGRVWKRQSLTLFQLKWGQWLSSIDRLSTCDLLIDPKVPLQMPILLLAASSHYKKTDKSHFLQCISSIASMYLCQRNTNLAELSG